MNNNSLYEFLIDRDAQLYWYLIKSIFKYDKKESIYDIFPSKKLQWNYPEAVQWNDWKTYVGMITTPIRNIF